ncbi:MAG: hypothetical protein SFT68_00580 [Rickettsiaceae bacterium]|nr:hypothetical protein [Rickettsiaceae bacterium]
MFKLLFKLMIPFIFTLIYVAKSYGNQDRIAIIIGNKAITFSQLRAREDLLKDFQGIESPTKEQQALIRTVAGQSIIDESLMIMELAKHKSKIQDLEVDIFIKNLETSRKMPVDMFKHRYKSKPLLYESFKDKIRGEIAKSRLVSEISSGISISQQEVDEIAIKYHHKNAELLLKVFEIDNKPGNRERLERVHSKFLKCDSKFNDPNINSYVVNQNLEKLTKKERDAVLDIRDNDFSAIIEGDEKLKMYQVCSKKLIGISENELESFTNIIGNKLITLKFVKYIETLRKKYYIMKSY